MKRLLTLSLLALAAIAVACGSDDDEDSAAQSRPAATQQAAATQAATTQVAGAATGTAAAASSVNMPRKVSSSVTLNGAGATFPAPFYTKAFDEYNKFDSNVRINYQGIGSSGGIRNFTEKTVNFGATDAFMSTEQLQAAGGAENVLHIPTAAGAVVVTYNIPNFNGALRFSPETLAGIFLGEIESWNDAKIKADNPNVNLPNADIAVVHRSDGSGTTNTFTSYLAAISTPWKDQVGAGTTVKWPTGIGASGNDGVTGQIKQTPGSLGYVELIYAEQNKLPTAELKNKDGKWVKPSLQATSAALADPSAVKDDLSANLINNAGENTYPIVTLTWLLVYKNQTNQLKAEALTSMLWWMTSEPGQKIASDLQYAPLPKEVVTKVQTKLKQITVDGKPVIS
jgi:phosphate transport system substrate-binding protein